MHSHIKRENLWTFYQEMDIEIWSIKCNLIQTIEYIPMLNQPSNVHWPI